MMFPLDTMTRVEVEGWFVLFDAPTLIILDSAERVVFHSNEWNPNMADPMEDALAWASAVASPDSGLTIEYDDDPGFGHMVRRVRELAPPLFADTCSILAQEREEELCDE